MFITKRKHNEVVKELTERLDNISNRVMKVEDKLPELTMSFYSEDFLPPRVRATYGGFEVIPGRGDQIKIPLKTVIQMVADAAGVELKLEPKVCTGGEVVAVKRRKTSK